MHTTLEADKSPQEVFNIITRDVSKWWGGSDLTGNSTAVNDEFSIRHAGAHYSRQKLVEVIPDKKIVWLVTESTLDWLRQDKQEWTNTRMIFDISTDNGKTILQFTHAGLLPEMECYGRCSAGWNRVIKDWLFNFIARGEIRVQQPPMKGNDFTRSISVSRSAREVMTRINRVTEWWGITFNGSCDARGDRFVIRMGGDSFFNMTVAELIPDKKIVWLVTDCNMPWYSDKKEWMNTGIVFNLEESKGITTLTFIHEGLTPRLECYKDCEPGWNHWITRSLFSYLTTGKGDFKQR